jgi:hypothetical protein
MPIFDGLATQRLHRRQKAEAAIEAKRIEAGLLMACGVAEDDLAASREYGEVHTYLGRKLMITVSHFCSYEIIKLAGKSPRGGGTALFEQCLTISAEAGFSTVNLPRILGNVANKVLLDPFTRTSATYEQVADQADFSNFHVHTIYRLDHLGDFAMVPKDGEIKHGSLSQTYFQNKVDTYGQMLTLSRQDIVNDNLNAFLQLPAMLGRKAAVAIEKSLYLQIAGASDTFYSTAQGNRLVGALGITELGAAEAALANMADAWGDPIYAMAKFLLVPPALKYMADQIYTSALVDDFTPGPNTARPTDNPFRGRFEVLASPYLQLTTVPGNSPTTWHLLADPLILPAFQVVYLDGRRAPTIESQDTLFNTLGLSMRAVFDFGVAQLDFRDAIKSTAM